MSIFSTLNLIILVICVAINILLAFVVFRSNQRSSTNIIFAALSFIISAWLVILLLSFRPLQSSLAWIRISMSLAVVMSFLFFLFANTFPDENLNLKKRQLYSLIFVTVSTVFVAFSAYSFSGIKIINNFPSPTPGPGLISFGIYVISFMIGSVYSFLKRIKAVTILVRNQMKFIIAGMILMYGFIIVTIFLPLALFDNIQLVPLFPVYTLFFTGIAAYTIIKHNLFNTKIITTEITTFSIWTVLLSRLMFPSSIDDYIANATVFVATIILGAFLIRSVKNEVEQRQHLEQITQELERANIQLQELDKQKTEFLSIASHQLRTPLSILKGYIELIIDGAYGKVDKKTVKVLQDMDLNNEHLIKLVDEFLNISRIEQGRAKYNFSLADVSGLTESVVKDFKIKAKEKKIKILWDKPKDIMQADCDQEKIHNVVFNFVDNALKYSEGGEIKVVLKQEENGISVRVQDSGMGFNKVDEVSFYQKFYRGDNVKSSGIAGTGLGLYVCRKFIEAHNGRVWARSPGLGKGSEFGFWIPLKHVV